MSLRLILGRAGSGKTHQCLHEIQTELGHDPFGPPLILLVPEQATFQMEQALIRGRSGRGMARARVLSFQRLAQLVFAEAGGVMRPRLGEVGKRMLLRSLVYRRRDQLELFRQGVGQAGFIERLAKTITEFQTYGYTPTQVRDMAEDLVAARTSKGRVLAKKLRDLALLYGDFTEYIADRYTDPANMLGEAAHAMHHTTLLAGAHVWIDGFAGFTPQEYRVLQTICTRAQRVNMALCLDPTEFMVEPVPERADDFSLFKLSMETGRDVVALCRQIGVAVEPHTVLTVRPGASRFKAPVLAHLERAWDKQPVQEFVGDTDSLRVQSAENRITEVEAVAAEIHRLVREKGYRFKEISVIARSLDTYAPHIASVFHKSGIPYFLDQRRPMLFHPLVQAVSAALEAIGTHWSSDAIFRYLKTDLAPVERDEVDRLENYVLEHGITGRVWVDERPWHYGRRLLRDDEDEVESNPDAPKRDLDAVRRVALQPLVQLAESIGRGRTFSPREAAEALWKLLDVWRADEQISRWVDEAEERGETELVSLHTQVWNCIIELLEQMANVLPQDSINLDELIAMIEEGVSSLRLGLIPPKLDQVLVGAIDRSRQPNVRAAFVLGLVDREFPAVPQEDVLFTDAERESLVEAGFVLSETSRARMQHEFFYAYIAITRATERLILSTPRSEGSGRALLPSMVIERTRRLVPSLPIHNVSRVDANDLTHAVTPQQAVGCVIGSLRSGPVSETSLDAYEWLVTHPRYAQHVKPTLRSLTYSNAVQALSPELSTALYGDPLITSVSRLERFASCPFQHFAAYGLGLKERAVLRLDPSRLGILTHSVLKAFVDHLIRSGGWETFSEDEAYTLVDRLTELAAKELAGEVLLSSGRQRYLIDVARRTLRTAVRLMGEHAKVSGFKPMSTELSFGRPGDALPGWELTLDPHGKAQIIGVIDRVDRARIGGVPYLRVMDYKSYKRRIVWSDILQGLELQLLVYLGVASEGEGMTPAGAFYVPIRDPFVDSEADVNDETAWNLRKAELRAEGILAQDADAAIALQMDAGVVPSSSSQLLPFGLKKDGTFTAYSSVAPQEDLALLIEEVRSVASSLASRIQGGEHDGRPFRRKSGVRACDRCPYHSVCRFDVLMPGSDYNHLESYKKDELWRRLRIPDEIVEGA